MSAGFLEGAAAELGLEDLAVRKVGGLRGPQSRGWGAQQVVQA